MAEADFLSFLVDETLKLQKSGEGKLSSLELKLSDYKLEFMKGEYIPQSQVLRFFSKLGTLDIPVNWSVFALDNAEKPDFLIGEDNDNDLLLKVFKKTWNESFEQLLVTHADGFCYIIGIKAGEEYYLHDILNPQELLKAA